jgi:hypothetical protein
MDPILVLLFGPSTPTEEGVTNQKMRCGVVVVPTC